MFGGAHWLPNGQGLLVLAGDQIGPGGATQLWHVSYPDGKARRITNDLNNYVSLSLNRDGSELVAVQRELTSHIWVASVDGSGSSRQVTNGRQDGNTYMSWTSDGKIVYSAPDNGQTTQVWITGADGSSPQQLTRGPYTACPAVCGNGHLIFQSFRGGSHIWRSNLDGGGAVQLTNGEGEFQPACSPDGTWLTYFRSDPKSVGVWRMPIDSGKPVRIWEHRGLSQISPDGKWVLIHDYQTTPPKSIIIPASGGQPIKTFDPDPELGLPWIWTADGRGLFYVRTSGGVSNVWQRSLDGRETRQLTNFDSDLIETNFGGLALSRDGKYLAMERGSTRSDIVLIKDLNAK
jgi:Tol biopolymer transport system component